MKKLIPIALFALAALIAGAQTTSRKNLRPASGAAVTTTAAADNGTVIEHPAATLVAINGYDKPLRSRRETFFVTNHSETDAISSITITLTYSDTKGRMLHKATKTLTCEIPPSETRQLNMPSWDVQQNFYYIRSTVPTRVQQATPYDVTIDIDAITAARTR